MPATTGAIASSYVRRWQPSLVGRSGDTTAVGDGEEAEGGDDGDADGEESRAESAESVHPASARGARSAARRTGDAEPAVRHTCPSVHSLNSAAIVPPSSYAASRSASPTSPSTSSTGAACCHGSAPTMDSTDRTAPVVS